MNDEELDQNKDDDPENQSPAEKETESDLSNLISHFPDDVAPILDKLPDDQKFLVARAIRQMSIQHSWEGPLPHPETLEGYNDCFEGGAKAVFELTKSQSDHRKNLETMAITRELNQSGRGQIFAFILAIGIFMSGVFLAYTGHETVAAIAMGLDVVGLAAVFIVGRNGIKMDLGSKKKSEKENPDKLPAAKD